MSNNFDNKNSISRNRSFILINLLRKNTRCNLCMWFKYGNLTSSFYSLTICIFLLFLNSIKNMKNERIYYLFGIYIWSNFSESPTPSPLTLLLLLWRFCARIENSRLSMRIIFLSAILLQGNHYTEIRWNLEEGGKFFLKSYTKLTLRLYQDEWVFYFTLSKKYLANLQSQYYILWLTCLVNLIIWSDCLQREEEIPGLMF